LSSNEGDKLAPVIALLEHQHTASHDAQLSMRKGLGMAPVTG